MKHVKLYKKRGVPGITRIEEADDGKKTKLDKGEFGKMDSLKEITKKIKTKKDKK